MSHPNSKIIPPIDLIGDVDYTLGINTGDVKTACMGGALTTTCKINMWSKYKPLRGGTYYTDIQSGYNWKDAVDINYNCGIIYSPNSLSTIVNLYTGDSITRFFTYNRLTANDWGRLTDFHGYYHLAKSPFGEYLEITSGATLVPGTTNEYNSIKGKLVTFTLHNALVPNTADNVLIQDLGHTHSTAHLIGNWYFGVVASNNGVYARSNIPVVINNNTYSYKLVLDTSDASSSVGLNLSTIFYPILHASKGTDGPEGAGVIYQLKVSQITTTTTTETIGLDSNSGKMGPVKLNLVPAIKLETNDLAGLTDTTRVRLRKDPYNLVYYKLSFRNYLTSDDSTSTTVSFSNVKIYIHYKYGTGGEWWDDGNHRPLSSATDYVEDSFSNFSMNLASSYSNPTVYTTNELYYNILPSWASSENNIECRIVARGLYTNKSTGAVTPIWIDEAYTNIKPY